MAILTEAPATHDFDLHGLVGVRLMDAAPGDVAAVRRQLGPIGAPLAREPDIVIRFTERLARDPRMRLIGAGDAAFLDDRFFVLRGKHKTPVRMELAFDRLGDRPLELRCERGLLAVPHLLALLNLSVVARGGLPLHASAFRYRGRDVLAAGWARSGKTELLLGFAAEGARYIGDEWIYLDRRGDRMRGIPEPIRVWDRDLRQFPMLRRRLHPAQRTRLASLRHAARWAGRIGGRNGRRPPAGWRRTPYRVGRLVEEQRNVRVSPARLFGRARVTDGSPERVLFLASHASPEVVVRPIPPDEVAARMTVSLQEERADLLACYRRFRFAFPSRRSRLLDSIERKEDKRLRRFLAGRDCWIVLHPHPPSIPRMVDAVRPLLLSREGRKP